MALHKLILVALVALPFGLAGCDVDEGPVEETGEELDEAGDELEDATDGAAEAADEAIDPAQHG